MITPRSVFRFIYGSFYFFLCILLVALLFVTPGDIIYQAYLNDQWYNIWILAAALVFIGVIVSFIYALRLFNNKTILASIPKQWVPIEKGDAPKTVIRMISASLDRSAAIAFEARPRALGDMGQGGEDAQGQGEANGEVCLGGLRGEASRQGEEEKEWEGMEGSKSGFQLSRLRNKAAVEEELGVTATPLHRPVWGDIEHGGWASPDAKEVPNLQYSTVLSELPHLIEAKALTQAPPDPQSATNPPMLDPDAVAMLERPLHLDLRGYIDHLSSFGMLDMDGAVNEFLVAYERARFSTRPVSSEQFHELMRFFAGLLRSMGPLDPDILFPVEEQASQNGDDSEDGEGGGGSGNIGAHTPTESDIDDQAPFATGQTTPQSNLNLSRSATQSSRCSSFASRRRPPLSMVARNSSAGTRQMTFRTAPSTRNAPGSAGGLSRSSSADSFAHTKRPYHSWSNGSLRSRASKAPSSSVASTSGASGSSVIRLAGRSDRTDLPYVLTLNDSR